MEYAYATTTDGASETEALNYELAEAAESAAANLNRSRIRRQPGNHSRANSRSHVAPPKVKVVPAVTTIEIPEKHQPVHQSRAMQFLLHRAEMVAKLPVPVIIAGATGTGKSRLVDYVHRNSSNGEEADAPLIELNCRLFSGASGAEHAGDEAWRRLVRRKLNRASAGTLWVRHMDELELALRRDLLALLCEACGPDSAGEQARLVLTMTSDDGFEADCRNRLGAVMLLVPTLAERREDILPLARAFLKDFSVEYRLERNLNARAIEYIKTYAWPGNVRQLQSTLLNALIQAPGQSIRYEDLAAFTGDARSEYEGGPVPTFQEQVDNFERGLLQSVLEQCHGNQSQVSRMLQMNRGTLIRKIKQYELDGCGRPAFWQSDAV